MLQSSSRGGCLPGRRGRVLLGPGGVCLVQGVVLLGPGGGSPWSGGVLPAGGSAWSQGGVSAWSQGGSPETPPVNRITDTCKNITLATTSLRPVTMLCVPDWYSLKPTNSAVDTFGMNLPWFLAQSNPTEAGFAVKVPFNKADVVNP